MLKKISVISSFILAPIILSGCSLFQTEKEAVLEASSSFVSSSNKTVETNLVFSNSSTSIDAFSFLDNQNISLTEKIVSKDKDITLTYSNVNKKGVENTLFLSERSGNILIKANPLIEQLSTVKTIKKEDKRLNEDSLYVSSFNKEYFNQFFTIISVPFNDLIDHSKSIPKENFKKVASDSSDATHTLSLNAKEISSFIPSLHDFNVRSMTVDFKIVDEVLVATDYTIDLDITNDNKIESLVIHSTYDIDQKNKLDSIGKEISVDDLLNLFEEKKSK